MISTGTRACQKFDFFARKGCFLFNSKHFYQENYDVMLTLDESSNYMKKSISQNFHKRVLYDRKVTLKKLMWQQAFLPTEAIKVSEKKQLNIKLCLAPFASKFVLQFTPNKSNTR